VNSCHFFLNGSGAWGSLMCSKFTTRVKQLKVPPGGLVPWIFSSWDGNVTPRLRRPLIAVIINGKGNKERGDSIFGLFLGFLLDPTAGGDMFLWKIGLFSNCTALQSRRTQNQ
jgi:hypothetical protein